MTGWPPTTESELDLAIDAGSLTEKHHVELKRQLNNGPKDNVELARDVASLAVDGGLLFIGIEEHKDPPGPPTKHPIPLTIRERIEQVARSRIDPPLSVETIDIPVDPDPSKGVVVVVVPASPDAPHMVAGEYFGRADTHKFRMGDAEVRRLHATAAQRADGLAAALDALVASDPVLDQTTGHLIAVARPVTNRSGMIIDHLPGSGGEAWINAHVAHGPPAARFLGGGWTPDLGGAAQIVSRTADGWSVHTAEMGRDGRGPHFDCEVDLLEFEVTEDGEVRVFFGRAAEERGGTRWFLDNAVNGITKRLVLVARELSKETRFFGSWEFAVAVTGLRGAVSHGAKGYGNQTPYSNDEYRQTAKATAVEVRDHVDDVTSKLVGRLNRALNNGTIEPPASA